MGHLLKRMEIGLTRLLLSAFNLVVIKSYEMLYIFSVELLDEYEVYIKTKYRFQG